MPFTDFQDEIVSLVAAATGTVPSGGSQPQTLFTSVEAAKISIVGYLAQGQAGGMGRPSPPYVAIQVGRYMHDAEWGPNGKTYRAPVTVAIVAPSSLRTQRQMLEAMRALAKAFDDHLAAYDTFQAPPERGTVDGSEENTVLQSLMVDRKADVVAATVSWEPGFLLDL